VVKSGKMKKYLIVLACLFLFLFVGCKNDLNNKKYYYEAPSSIVFSNTFVDTTHVDCVVAPWFGGKEKAVVFTWDDCSYGIADVMGMFDKYGLKTTFFVNTAAVDDMYKKIRFFYKGTINGVLKDALANGHEISSHTHDHINLS